MKYSKPMKRINIMLDDETAQFLRGLADGNLSEGIRVAAKFFTETGRVPDQVLVDVDLETETILSIEGELGRR